MSQIDLKLAAVLEQVRAKPIMGTRTCFVALVMVTGLVLNSLGGEPRKGKPNPNRLKGMKAAVEDIEKGLLKLKEFPLPDPPWFADYLALLKKESGVTWEMVDLKDYKEGRAGLDGYNDVMRVEIEYRYEPGILDKLQKKAKDSWEKNK
jgi:hypothetical protein